MHDRDFRQRRKVIGGNFSQPPDGAVFGFEVLRRVWYVTRTACLTRILTRTQGTKSDGATECSFACNGQLPNLGITKYMS